MKESIEVKIAGMVVNIPYDTPNRNGQIYPKNVLESAIERYNYQLKLKERKEKINKIQDVLRKRLF